MKIYILLKPPEVAQVKVVVMEVATDISFHNVAYIREKWGKSRLRTCFSSSVVDWMEADVEKCMDELFTRKLINMHFKNRDIFLFFS